MNFLPNGSIMIMPRQTQYNSADTNNIGPHGEEFRLKIFMEIRDLPIHSPLLGLAPSLPALPGGAKWIG